MFGRKKIMKLNAIVDLLLNFEKMTDAKNFNEAKMLKTWLQVFKADSQELLQTN